MKTENEITKNWIEEGRSIYFWGASQRAQGLIKGFVDSFPNIVVKGVIDKGLAGTHIIIGGTEYKIIAPDEMEIKSSDRIVLFLSRKTTYEAVKSILEKQGLFYGERFIDASNVRDVDGVLLSKYKYSDITITEIYSPWLSDETFLRVMDQIKDHTLVDILRCYELWRLVRQTKKCASGKMLEVGVWRGGTGALISAAAKSVGIDTEIYLADTFEGVVKVSDVDISYVGGEHNDTSEDIVKTLIRKMDLKNIKILKGIFPDDFAGLYDNDTYRFVHVDVDIYQSAKDVFDCIWSKMEHGGCVVFDDYGNMYTSGVTTLCEQLSSEIEDGIFLYNMNKHGVFIKL